MSVDASAFQPTRGLDAPIGVLVGALALVIATGAVLQTVIDLDLLAESGATDAAFGAVMLAVLLGDVVFVAACASATLTAALARARWLPLVAFATAAFVVAQFLSYDSYYGREVRFADTRGFLTPWLVAYASLAVFAAWAVRRRLTAGLVATTLVVWLAIPLLMSIAMGH